MPETTMQMTNISCSDTIFSPFSLQLEYNLLTQQGATLTVTDANGASFLTSPQILLPTGGTPTTVTVTLTYNNPAPPISGESISAVLTDSSLNLLAKDGVGSINVFVNAPGPQPVQINSPSRDGRPPTATHRIKSGDPLSGSFNPGAPVLGVYVVLMVERRIKGSKHRRLIYLDDAIVPAAGGGAPGTWSHNTIAGTQMGDILVATVLDAGSNVVGTTRAVYTS